MVSRVSTSYGPREARHSSWCHCACFNWRVTSDGSVWLVESGLPRSPSFLGLVISNGQSSAMTPCNMLSWPVFIYCLINRLVCPLIISMRILPWYIHLTECVISATRVFCTWFPPQFYLAIWCHLRVVEGLALSNVITKHIAVATRSFSFSSGGFFLVSLFQSTFPIWAKVFPIDIKHGPQK